MSAPDVGAQGRAAPQHTKGLTMPESLKPCPFCGKLPTIQPWHGGRPTKRAVMCENPRCHVQPMVTGEWERYAAARWNRRVSK